MKELTFEESTNNGLGYRIITEFCPEEFMYVLVFQNLFDDGPQNPFVAAHDRVENEWRIQVIVDKGKSSASVHLFLPCEPSDVWTYIFDPATEEKDD